MFLVSCATSGPVETTQAESDQPIVAQPSEFISPLDEMVWIRNQIEASRNQLPQKPDLRGPKWHEYVNWMQALDEREAEQSALEAELAANGEVELFPGRSYSFELESYCVHGAQARPVTGDGLKVAPLSGPAARWIPKILDEMGSKKLSQEQIQYLIWALLYDTRFDELSKKNQNLLLQFYPDAPLRFGNRRLEEFGKNIIRGLLPSGVIGTIDQVSEYRSRVLELRDDYQELEHLLAPKTQRTQTIPVGWMKMPEGYLMHLTADGYQRVHVDLYVPEEEKFDRTPQVKKTKKVFHPSRWVGLPTQGQRLAISTKAASRAKTNRDSLCKSLQNWKPKNCHELTTKDRETILKNADPENFTRTQYRSPPGSGVKTEEQTDCSNFVNEIFKRSGIEYPYADTSTFQCIQSFHETPTDQALPGDLVLYRGHIGILDTSGKVISATSGGPKKRSMRSPNDPDFIPSITRLNKNQAGEGKSKILQWRCP